MVKEKAIDIHELKPTDKDYPTLIMRLVPKAEQYTLFSINGTTVVPLFQVIDAITVIKPDTIKRNGIEYCANCGAKIKTDEVSEDCISRQAVLEWCGDINMDVYTNEVKEYVLSLPSVNPQSKAGHWVIIEDCEHFMAKCSECGKVVDSRMINNYPYCHCGCRMVEPQESEV